MQMSLLRKHLKLRFTCVLLLGLLGVAVGIDGFRPPDKQIVSRIYVATVHAYQDMGSPFLGRYVQCRYTPTCSRYSVAAVQKYGLGKGLLLTAARLRRCRGRVPLGTADPLP